MAICPEQSQITPNMTSNIFSLLRPTIFFHFSKLMDGLGSHWKALHKETRISYSLLWHYYFFAQNRQLCMIVLWYFIVIPFPTQWSPLQVFISHATGFPHHENKPFHTLILLLLQMQNVSLRWRNNERDGVSYDLRLAYLLNRFFRRRSKKISNSASLAFVRGIYEWLVDSPHKGPVTRRMFPFDDVFM